MEYIFIFIGLFIVELFYFRIANHFNIIDKPNSRSSHSEVTLRGGGIVFYFSLIFYQISSGFSYPYFFLALTAITFISFMDDLYTLSSKVRLVVHFASVLLMFSQLNMFIFPWYVIGLTFIIVVGIINAYNFMDGINGMTAVYSITILSLLMLCNNEIGFLEQDLFTYSFLSVLVFTFFNFRARARCFAGDVGSIAMAFIIIFGLLSLILTTGNPIYILFLLVYGIDTFWTIVRRLTLKENIFDAHRSHLYQFLSNEVGMNKLVVSSVYAIFQFIIGLVVIRIAHCDITIQAFSAATLVLSCSALYLIVRKCILKKYLTPKNEFEI